MRHTLQFDSSQVGLQDIFRRQSRDAHEKSLQIWEDRLGRSLKSVKGDPQNPQPYLDAAYCQKKLRRHAEALKTLEKGLDATTETLELREMYINLCTICNRTEQAIAASQDAIRAYPGETWFQLKEALLLPVIYSSTHEIARYRARYSEGLHRILVGLSLESPEARLNALHAIGNYPNFYIGYQAEDDRDLQLLYGKLVRRIMSANFTDEDHSSQFPRDVNGNVLRVGYVSGRFYDVSATKCFLGWLQGHDKLKFQIFTYHLGAKTDRMTGEVMQAGGTFHHLTGSIEDTIRVIRGDHLDVLVLLDVGLDAKSTQLAALRHAPVQCATWDQPITSGMPTVDYYLSSELMEPEDAQRHYTEELIELPGLSICFQNPVIPKSLLVSRSREELGLRADAAVYLCSQLANKLLPTQDAVFAEIAKRVPHAQFVFLMNNDLVSRAFMNRLESAFSAVGLHAADYCKLLPETNRFEYWSLNLMSDVFLDTMGWSGGVSTVEAAACGLPIVTLPGKFLRGRHAMAILRRMGVTETICANPQEYSDVAARLGTNPVWRSEVAAKTLGGALALYHDDRCQPALEDFYRNAVRKRFAAG